MKDILQEEFDKWSEPITGSTSDVNLSSHGRAFVGGFVAGLRHAAKMCNELEQHYEHTIAPQQCAYNISQRAGSFHGHD